MAELSNIALQLSKGKKLDVNLSQYAAGMASLYNRIGHIKLALNLYTFAEVYGEEESFLESVKPYADKLSEIVKDCIISDTRKINDDVIADIDNVRNELKAYMEVLTSYVDRFQVFEYVLNRIEYNYEESTLNEDYYEDKFEKDIFNYILSDKDNTVINMKISQVVSQLPMRLSKNKFFDLLKDAFSLYKGSEVKAVEDFVYMLKSVAMLHTPDMFDTAFPVLNEKLNELVSFEYTDMTEENYRKASACLKEATEYVTNVTDTYVLLTETLNDAYTILLSNENAISDISEKDNCLKIINDSNVAIIEKRQPSEDLGDIFMAIEGIQEKLFMQLSNVEYALDDVKNSLMDKVAEYSLEKGYVDLFKMSLLNSGSNFVALDTELITESITATEGYITEQFEKLSAELMSFFDTHERCFNRAVMANILGSLPVFFNNQEEIKKYIHVALGQCRDNAERQACMNIMLMLFEE